MCSKKFPRQYALRRHESEVHTEGNKQHKCTNCGKEFLREGNLKRHSQFCNSSKKTSSGRRSLSVKNKKALICILESENFMEESINRATSKFKISNRQVKNVYKDRVLLAVMKSGKHRQAVGGRKLDDWSSVGERDLATSLLFRLWSYCFDCGAIVSTVELLF